jgi:hypothetical protein
VAFRGLGVVSRVGRVDRSSRVPDVLGSDQTSFAFLRQAAGRAVALRSTLKEVCALMRPARRDERGAAAVEFALILIPMLTLIMGLIQFSMYFYAGQSGAAAAHDGARRAAVGDETCAQLTTAARNKSGFVDSGFNVTRTYFVPGTTTQRAASAIAVGDDVRVIVQYNTVDFDFPFIPLPNGGVIREEAYSRLENKTASSTAC